MIRLHTPASSSTHYCQAFVTFLISLPLTSIIQPSFPQSSLIYASSFITTLFLLSISPTTQLISIPVNQSFLHKIGIHTHTHKQSKSALLHFRSSVGNAWKPTCNTHTHCGMTSTHIPKKTNLSFVIPSNVLTKQIYTLSYPSRLTRNVYYAL